MATIILSNATVIENPQVGTIVGFIGVAGGRSDGENFDFRLIDPGSGRFEIRKVFMEGVVNYVLVVKTSVTTDGVSLFDFENDALNHFPIRIAATGDGGTVISGDPFTVTVTDNTAPTGIELSNSSVLEHSPAGTVIGSLLAIDSDDDDTFIYTLTDNAGG